MYYQHSVIFVCADVG